jgi:hypothetical protein
MRLSRETRSPGIEVLLDEFANRLPQSRGASPYLAGPFSGGPFDEAALPACVQEGDLP